MEIPTINKENISKIANTDISEDLAILSNLDLKFNPKVIETYISDKITIDLFKAIENQTKYIDDIEGIERTVLSVARPSRMYHPLNRSSSAISNLSDDIVEYVKGEIRDSVREAQEIRAAHIATEARNSQEALDALRQKLQEP